MKKVLLTLACATAMVASAQVAKVENPAKAKMDFSRVSLDKKAVVSTTKKSDAPMKSAADGVYYRTPAGSMWAAVPQPFYNYNTPYHVVAPWTDFTFINMSDKKNGTWGIQTASTFVDLSEEVDANGNYTSYYNGRAAIYYAPQYTEGSTTYIPTHTLRSGSKETMANCVQGVEMLSFQPMNVDGGGLAARGVLTDENLFGAGAYDGIAMSGVDAYYPAPMSPLYVEYASIYARVVSSKEPLSGKTLTMTIYNLEDENAEPLVLTCTEDDLVFDAEQSGVKYYMANFSKKVKDEISGSFVADPFVIDYPTEVVISGLDQAGVNIGFGGIDIADEFVSDNENENHAYCTYYDEAAGAMDGFTYQGNVTLALCVYGMMDICSVATELQSTDNNFYECNGIKVSDDGQSFVNCEFGQSLAGVRVYTALDWTDGETGEEMYWSDDMYDYEWIQNLVVSSLKNSQGNTVGMHDVGAICDALPSGVTKRYAVIHLNGRGVTSEPIFVLQGDITLAEAKADYIATGITNVKNNEAKKSTKKFNLAGQQVDNNFKGIVISNGKKTIKRN